MPRRGKYIQQSKAELLDNYFIILKVGCWISVSSIERLFQHFSIFSTSDWFSAMFKISTDYGSRVPVGSCFETINNIEQHQAKVAFVIHRNSSATFAWA